jgi:formyltetrahydrofolate-dependent phosphoribosylglycinamide formyltransferase
MSATTGAGAVEQANEVADGAPCAYRSPETPPVGEPLRIVVLVSGTGTTLQNLLNEADRGRLLIDCRLVISSRRTAYALKRAKKAGIATQVLKLSAHEGDRAAYSDAVFAAAEAAGAQLICMAGFRVALRIPDRWLGRVLNIHPALLPSFGGMGFYGDRVHEAVLGYGARLSGCTVHVADNEVDGGPIVLQRCVPVLQDDTVDVLRARVFHEECLAYPQAIRLFAEGRIRFEERRVRFSVAVNSNEDVRVPGAESLA